MEIRRGFVRSFDRNSYTASVQIAGSLATWLHGVPVARNISTTRMRAGSKCAVILFDSTNPLDAWSRPCGRRNAELSLPCRREPIPASPLDARLHGHDVSSSLP